MISYISYIIRGMLEKTPEKSKPQLTFRQKTIMLLSSNKFESFVIFLLFLYILVVITQIILDELFYNSDAISFYQ